MNNVMQTTYRGVEIIYNEHESKFMFEFRGRERAIETLAKAKELIDSPEPREKSTFIPIDAWLAKYSGDPEQVKVTSIAAPGRYDGSKPFVWVTRKSVKKGSYDAKRSKVSLDSVFLSNPRNDAIVSDWLRLADQIEKLHKEKTKLRTILEKLELPTPNEKNS